MDPYLENRLRLIKTQNEDAFKEGRFDVLFDKFNDGEDVKMPDVASLETFYSRLDFTEEDEKKNLLSNETIDPQSVVSSDSLPASSEEEFSLEQLLENNKETTKALQNYISDIESVGGSYNSYQGSFKKGSEVVDLQNMSIKAALQWQEENGGKAIGRYQFKGQTLKEMLSKAGLTEKDQFTPENQDKIFLQLLLRRGYEGFLRGEGYEDFSFGLAKEWAATPLIQERDGKLAGESYYEGQGSNKAKGDPKLLENILRGKDNGTIPSKIRSDYYSRVNRQAMNELFSGITPDFLKGFASISTGEEALEVQLKKTYQHLGFDFRQDDTGSDAIVVSHPSLDDEFTVNLGSIVDRPTENEMIVRAKGLQSYMKKASFEANPEFRYYDEFKQNPAEAINLMGQEILMPADIISKAQDKRQALEEQIKDVLKYLPGMQENPAYLKIKNEIREQNAILEQQEKRREQFSRTAANLIDNMGGLEQYLQDPIAEKELIQQIAAGNILPNHLKLPSIKIDGRISSLYTLRDMLLDTDMRGAIHSGEIDIEVTKDDEMFKNTAFKAVSDLIADQAISSMEQNLKSAGVAGQVEWFLRSTAAPIIGSLADMSINIGEFLLDVAQMPSDAFDEINKLIYSDEGSEKIQDMTADVMGQQTKPIFDSARAWVQDNIHSVVPETSGDMLDSETLTEMLQKGTVASSQSLPYMALFAVNPSLGIGITGASTYGSELSDMRQMKTLAQNMLKEEGYVPNSLEEYLRMSKSQMRFMAGAKGIGEAAITGFTTARYFRNLSKLGRPGMRAAQFREAARAYRRGYMFNVVNQLAKAGSAEFLEEGLVAIENMAVDDIFGVKNYTSSDYIRAAGNAGLTAFFSTTPLATLGAHRQRGFAKNLYGDHIVRIMLQQNPEYRELVRQRMQNLDRLTKFQKQGKNNKVVLKDDAKLMEQMIEQEQKVRDILNEASPDQLADFASTEIDIQTTIQQAKEASMPISLDDARKATEISDTDQTQSNMPSDIKRRTQNRLTALVEKQQEIYKQMDPENALNVSNNVKAYIDSFVGVRPDSDSEIVMHSTADIDGVIETEELLANESASAAGIETLADTPTQEGGDQAVFFTTDPKWDMSNRNGKFFFDKTKMSEELTPGTSKKEHEVLSKGNVKLSRENGLLGIEFVEGVDVSDEVFAEPFIIGKETDVISDKEKAERIIELDKKNAQEFTAKRKNILEKAQKTADKYGVPVVITQHKGNHQIFDAINHRSLLQDEVVYPSNATAEDYSRFSTIVQKQVRQTPAKSDQEKTYRNTAKILDDLRGISTGRLPFEDDNMVFTDENIFQRAPEDVQKMIDLLSHVTDNDLSTAQRQSLQDFTELIGKAQSNPSVLNRIAISKFANELDGAMKLLDQVRLGTPADLQNTKINPQTRLESLFTIKNFEFASTFHVLNNLFKNSRMRQPISTVSNNIDVQIMKLQKEGETIRDEYQSLKFLKSDVHHEVYFSDENLVERVFLAHLGKYEVTNDVGDRAVESRQEQFDKKKQELQNYINEMTDNDPSSDAKKKQKLYQDTFDRMVALPEDYTGVEERAKDFNNEGVNYLRRMFEEDAQAVYNHMLNYHGRTPTRFANYLPLVLSNVGKTVGDAEGMYSDYQQMTTNLSRSTGTMQESGQQTGKLAGDLNFDNYENILFDLYTSGKMQMATAADIHKLGGFLKSKGFSDFFDVEKNTGVSSFRGDSTNFTRLRDFLLGTLANKVDRINKISTNKRIKSSAASSAKKIGRAVLKVAQSKRLSRAGMRMMQAYSAMFAQLPTLGAAARSYLLKDIGSFSLFMLGKNVASNANKMALLSASVTQSRGSGSRYGTGFLDGLQFEGAKTTIGKAVDEVVNTVNGITDDVLMKFTVSQTDQLAAQSTFLAFYMDYEMKNNPEAKKFDNYNDFFEYAAKNINKKAIAYADEQVERSQTQSTPWNTMGVYGQNHSGYYKLIADTFFLFGRFQQNRKVGIANDISILSDDFATSSDRAMAKRRLASAIIEIGVFKFLSPVFGVAASKSLTQLIRSLVGYDDELDKAAEILSANLGKDGKELAKSFEFKLSNYERDIMKEFTTSLIDGMIPAPTPGIANEVAFGLVNSIAKNYGADEDILNVFSPFTRNLFTDVGPVTDTGIGEGLVDNLGAFSLAAEDISNLYNSVVYLKSGKMPPYFNMGKDRYVKPIAKSAAEVLAVTTLLNQLVPSGDLNTFNRLLRGKIERDYLTTVAPQKKVKKEPVKIQSKDNNTKKAMDRRQLRQAIKESLE